MHEEVAGLGQGVCTVLWSCGLHQPCLVLTVIPAPCELWFSAEFVILDHDRIPSEVP